MDTKKVFLTFDDGPHPEITGEVLRLLANHNAKATFFCVGNNVAKYPEMYEKIVFLGHTTGNHTFNHLNGWQTENFTYFRNVLQCSAYVPSTLFRPPYGKITRSQANILNKRFRIIMWDVLSADFDPKISVEQCIDNVLRNVKPGSIIVFHDSEKAAPRMLPALEKVLHELSAQGFEFGKI